MQALPGLPAIKPGDDPVTLIEAGLTRADIALQTGDVLVVSSKIISKAENRFVDLRTITPSPEAQTLALTVQKDPRLVELILRNSSTVSRIAPGVLIVRHHLGFTSANAGIDASNVGEDSEGIVLLLPEDPDRTAADLREHLESRHHVRLGVVISDTHGRPFRFGNIGVAVGLAGIPALIDQRGDHDLFGRELKATVTPLADELAAAAGLISGQADEGQPVVLIRGVAWETVQHTAKDLIRPPEMDLYA